MAYGDDIFARQMEARRLYGTGLGDLAPYINKSSDVLAQGFMEAQKQPLATAQLEAELYGQRSALEMQKAKIAAEAEAAKEAKALRKQAMDETARHNREMEKLGAVSRDSQDRLIEKDIRLAANRIVDENKKISKEFDDSVIALKNAMDAFKQSPTEPALRSLAVATARAMGEKGPLSDTDLKSTNINSLPRDATAFINYLSGEALPLAGPNSPQAKDLLRVAQVALGGVEQKRKNVLSSNFEKSILMNPDIVNHPKYGKAMNEFAKKDLGVGGIEITPEGIVRVKREEQQAQQMPKGRISKEEAIAELQRRKAAQGAR